VARCDRFAERVAVTWTKGRDGILHLIHDFPSPTGPGPDGNRGAPPWDARALVPAAPDLHDGGLISQAAYANGNRFLQVTGDGNIGRSRLLHTRERRTWSSYWAPDGRTVYVVDDYVGVDVIKWTGPLYQVSGAATALPTPAEAGAVNAGSAPLPTTAAAQRRSDWPAPCWCSCWPPPRRPRLYQMMQLADDFSGAVRP